MIQLERAYDSPAASGGNRFLIERLWTRGFKRTSLELTTWIKDVAPSTGLRKCFSHDPAKLDEFDRRYFAELLGQSRRLAANRRDSAPWNGKSHLAV